MQDIPIGEMDLQIQRANYYWKVWYHLWLLSCSVLQSFRWNVLDDLYNSNHYQQLWLWSNEHPICYLRNTYYQRQIRQSFNTWQLWLELWMISRLLMMQLILWPLQYFQQLTLLSPRLREAWNKMCALVDPESWPLQEGEKPHASAVPQKFPYTP